MRLKSTSDFTSKAGSFMPGDKFKTDRSHGEFLINNGNAVEIGEEEFSSSLEIVKEELPAIPLGTDKKPRVKKIEVEGENDHK